MHSSLPLAYLLPLLQDQNTLRKSLIIVPTHELAWQVAKVLNTIGKSFRVQSLVLSNATLSQMPSSRFIICPLPFLEKQKMPDFLKMFHNIVFDEADLMYSSHTKLFRYIVGMFKPSRTAQLPESLDKSTQMIFCAATMPSNGKETTLGYLQKHVHNLQFVSSPR